MGNRKRTSLRPGERESLNRRFAAVIARLGEEQRKQMGHELAEVVKKMEEIVRESGDEQASIAVAVDFAKKWEMLAS